MSDTQAIFLWLLLTLVVSSLGVVLWDEIRYPNGRDHDMT